MSKNTKFKVGDRVVAGVDRNGQLTKTLSYDNYGERVRRGNVHEVLSNREVKVLWSDNFYNLKVFNQVTGRVERYDPATVKVSYLLLESEAEEKLSDLEADYKLVEKEIQEKLELAGALIREANNLSMKVGQSSVSDMYEAIQPLYDAMDDCGWNTSSFSC